MRKEEGALPWRTSLLCGAAMIALATPALAQSADGTVNELVVTGSRLSEASIAIGTDQATATVAITQDALLSAPAGITGLKMLESLPGFNVQANDALGMYEFGNSVSVRAFNFQQIGFTLDGIPMGRSDAFGGSPIYRYVDNENLAQVTASAGAGDVSLPSYSSLGPIVSYSTIRPPSRLGARFSQTFGSDNLSRNFFRVETGEIRGFSAYVSRSDVSGDLWRGEGSINRDHVEAKARWSWAPDSSLTFNFVANDYFDYDSPSITRAQYTGTANDPFGRSGRGFAYLSVLPVLPVTTPGIPFSNTLYNQFYKQAINSRTDYLYGLSLALPVKDFASVSLTTYYEDKKGYGVSPEAYATSLASHNAERLIVPGLFAPRGLQYGLSTIGGHRSGFTGSVRLELANHTITAGGWYEQDRYHRTQQRYNQANGDPAGDPLLNEPVHLQRNFVSTRQVTQLFVKDVIALLDERLRLDVGFKSLKLDYELSGYRNPADFIARRTPTLGKIWEDNFLPQVGAVWNFGGRSQLFASYSENMALPRGADDVFVAAGPAAPLPEAERATNAELGIRTNQPTFNVSFSLYQTHFKNRLQSFASVVPGSTTTETFFQNVGRVWSHGAELSGQWKPELFQGKAYFNANASYNISKFKDNYSTFTIAENSVPDFPEWVVQAGMTVEPTSWIVANLSARYIASRYSNFVNTEQVGGYTLLNAYVDIGGGATVGPLKEVKLRLNVDNLLDKQYLGTISAVATGAATFRPGPHRTVQASLTAQF